MADRDSLTTVLRKERALEAESIVFRAAVQPGRTRSEVILRHPAARTGWAVVQRDDVIGRPRPVPDAELRARERGFGLRDVTIRRGARVRHMRELPFRVGKDRGPRPLGRARRRSNGQYTTFYGAILRGFASDEFVLLPDPDDAAEWAIVKVADVLEPDDLARVPDDLLGGDKARPVYWVKIRNGAVIRTIREKQRIVDAPPPDPLSRRGPRGDVAWQGSCTQRAGGPCPGGGTGYPCTGGGACTAGVWPFDCSGTCKTVTSSIYGCVCDCC